jgi:hypothetical protein
MLAFVTETQDARKAVRLRPLFAAMGFRFSSPPMPSSHIHRLDKTASPLEQEVAAALAAFFWPSSGDFLLWLGSRLPERKHPFERVFIASELEILKEFSEHQKQSARPSHPRVALMTDVPFAPSSTTPGPFQYITFRGRPD